MQDVLIVGGAVMGASCAFWLTRMRPGLRVLVVEPDPSYATSSTALSAASIRQQFSNPVNVDISRFGIEFIRDFAGQIGEAGGVPDLGLKENGYLFLSGTQTGAMMLTELAEMQRNHGAATEVLAPEDLARKFPWMNVDDITAGSWAARNEGWFDNMGLLTGFRNAARAQGAEFVKDRVLSLERDGDRIVAAHLENGVRVQAGSFINCSGTRAATVLRTAGLDLPVEPRKRTVFVFDAPNARHPDAPLIIDHQGYYIRPEHGQWIGATVPADDGPCDACDFEPDHHLFEDQIWPALYHRAAGFDQCRVTRWWVGHYAYNTLDQNAILGRHPLVGNLYLANGFSGHGLQQAPAVGRGIAEQLLFGDWQTLDLSPLGVQRILDARPFAEAAIV